MTNEFTKDHTMITKGILIIMMLIHHVFVTDQIFGMQIVKFCKICVGVFVFITAYGMTKSYMRLEKDDPEVLFKMSIRRLIKLFLCVAIIYVLAVGYKKFIMAESIKELYGVYDWKVVLYMLIDVLGLANYMGSPTINITWWYLSYIILMILAMPFAYLLYKKLRYTMIPIICLLPGVMMISEMKITYLQLLPVPILGIAFAFEGWLRLEENGGGSPRIVTTIANLAMLFLGFELTICFDIQFGYLFSFTIPYLVLSFVGKLPIIRESLGFIGKNATNIFLTHTFIYYYLKLRT